MKKLMVAIAAVASAFGLYATDLPDGTSFENMTAGGDLATELANDSTASWSFKYETDETNTSIKAYVNDAEKYQGTRPTQYTGLSDTQNNYLDIQTAFTNALTREITGGVAFGGANLYVDTLVKFTVADEDLPVPSDAKIAVWLKEMINANDVVISTNLMVTCGDGAGGQKTYDCGSRSPTFADSWHRLTIKAMPGIAKDALANGFILYIDEYATSIRSLTEVDFGSLTLNDNAAMFASDNALFPANGSDTALHAIAAAGKGAIDDISFTAAKPDFVKADYQFVTFKVGTNVAKFDIEYGTNTDTEVSTSVRYLYQSGEQAKATNIKYADTYCGPETATFDVSPNGVYTIGEAKGANVKVGNKYFESITAAIAANPGNITIELGQSYSESLTINNTGYTTVIDFAGKTLTGEITANSDLVLTNSAANILTGGIVGVNDSTYGGDTCVVAMSANVKVYGGQFDGYVIALGGNTVYGGKFKDVGSAGASGFYLTLASGLTTEYANSYWTVIDVPTTAKLTIPELNNVTVSATTGTPAVVIATAAGEYTVDIGAEVAVTWTAVDPYVFGNMTQTTNETVTVNSDTTLTVPATQEAKAKKGSVFFLTLKAALEDSADGMITMLADATFTEEFEISKDKKIDMNGFKLTFELANGQIDISANVTIINSKATGGLLNRSKVLIARGYKLDCSTLAWGSGGLIATDDPATTKAKFDIMGYGELALGGNSPAPGEISKLFGELEEDARYTGAGVTYYYRGSAWQTCPWAGSGTEADPYIIKKVGDLVELQTWVADGKETAGLFFKQTDYVYMSNLPWTGIGTADSSIGFTGAKFKGTYDGNGKAIQSITYATANYGGLFNWVEGATIKNLKVNVIGRDYTKSGRGNGMVAGMAKDSAFVNVLVTGSISNEHNTAGFCVKAQNVSFTDCTNRCNIVFAGDKAAGFVAFESSLSGTIAFTNCSNEGSVKAFYEVPHSGRNGGAGGFIGQCSSANIIFKDCSNTGAITFDGNTDVPGLVQAGSFIGAKGGSNTVTVEGCTAAADKLAVGYNYGTKAADAFDFATVGDNVATFVTPVKDSVAEYKVMVTNATATLAAGESIKLNETLTKAAVAPADAEHYDLATQAISEGITLYSVTAKNYLIRFISGEGTLTTNDCMKAYGSEFTVAETNTYAAVSGKTFAGWTPAVVSPVAGAAEYVATYEASSKPLPPGGSTKVPASATEEEAKAAVTVEVPSTISTEIADAGLTDTYKFYFEPVARRASDSDPWTVTVEMKQSVSNEVQAAVNTTSASIVAAVGDPEVTEATLVTKPGLYYGLVQQDSVSGMGNASPDTWTLATKTSMTFDLDKTGDTKFYKVMCSETGGTSNEVQK